MSALAALCNEYLSGEADSTAQGEWAPALGRILRGWGGGRCPGCPSHCPSRCGVDGAWGGAGESGLQAVETPPPPQPVPPSPGAQRGSAGHAGSTCLDFTTLRVESTLTYFSSVCLNSVFKSAFPHFVLWRLPLPWLRSLSLWRPLFHPVPWCPAFIIG